MCLARGRGARPGSARWSSRPTSGRPSRSPSWRPCSRSPRGCPAARRSLVCVGRPRRSGVHRLEQRLARRRPRPGRGAAGQARRPGRRTPGSCARRRWSRRRSPSSCRCCSGVVPGLLLLVLVASGWAYNAGPQAHRGVRRCRYVVGLRRTAGRRGRRGARARPSPRGGWSPPAARSAPPRTWPTSPPISRTTWPPGCAACRTGWAPRVSAVAGALLLGGASLVLVLGPGRLRRRRRAGWPALARPRRRGRRAGRHRAVPPARLPGGDAADRARRRPAAGRRGRGHLTAAGRAGRSCRCSVAGRCRCCRCRCRCRCPLPSLPWLSALGAWPARSPSPTSARRSPGASAGSSVRSSRSTPSTSRSSASRCLLVRPRADDLAEADVLAPAGPCCRGRPR